MTSFRQILKYPKSKYKFSCIAASHNLLAAKYIQNVGFLTIPVVDRHLHADVRHDQPFDGGGQHTMASARRLYAADVGRPVHGDRRAGLHHRLAAEARPRRRLHAVHGQPAPAWRSPLRRRTLLLCPRRLRRLGKTGARSTLVHLDKPHVEVYHIKNVHLNLCSAPAKTFNVLFHSRARCHKTRYKTMVICAFVDLVVWFFKCFPWLL